MTNLDARKTVIISNGSYSVPADAEVILRNEIGRWDKPIALVADDPVDGLPSTLIAPRSAVPSVEHSKIGAAIAELGARFPMVQAGELARLAVGNPPTVKFDSNPFSELCASGALHGRGVGNAFRVYESLTEEDAPEGWPLIFLGPDEN